MVPPPPKTNTFSQFTAICGIFFFFFLCLNVFFLLFFLLFFYETARKPKNQKTKTFWKRFGLRLMFVFFWFSSSFFGFFGHDLKKTKKTQGFFGFLDKLTVKDL